MFGFLSLGLNWKWGYKLGQLSVFNQVLAVWGQLLLGILFGFLNDLLESMV